MLDFLVIAGLAAGFYMAWSIGANDLANAMGTAYGSGALKFRQIVVLGSILNVTGAVFFGSRVVETVGHGIIPEITPLAAFSALLAAAIFVTLASFFRMPVSATHSVIGAILGYGLLELGFEGIQWTTVQQVILSWVLSPLAGIAMSFLLFTFIRKGGLEKRKNISRGEKAYHLPQIISSSYESFAHGSNDVANSVALVGVILAGGVSTGEAFSLSRSVLLFGGVGIAFGLVTFGRRVMDTIGRRITSMTYSRAYSAEFSAATVVLVCSYFGMPVSTTHTSVGTVTGVGLARGRGNVNLGTLGKILASWVITLPIAGLFCGGIFTLLSEVV